MNMLRSVAVKLGILSPAEILIKRTHDGKLQKVASDETRFRQEGLASVSYIIQQTMRTDITGAKYITLEATL